MAITQRERYLGAMVGTGIGDAFGAPVEWFTPAKVAEYFTEHGYAFRDYENPWDIKRGKIPPGTVKAGQPTDDSELAAALAQSLVAKKGVCAEDIYYRLRSFIHDRKSILTDKAFGMGGTLIAALEPATHQESVAKFKANEIRTPPSNGSLMRCIAIPLLYFCRPIDVVVERAKKQSLVTHQNEESVAACMLFSVYAVLVLNGLPPSKAWERAKKLFSRLEPAGLSDEAKRTVLSIEPTMPNYETEMKGKEGYVVLSLRVAAWASVSATDFRDGIIKAVSVGGDTDTYAAIAGGILGARFGTQGIPAEWQAVLQGREIMEDLASKLYELSFR